jgi:two-component system cell cycle response regulator
MSQSGDRRDYRKTPALPVSRAEESGAHRVLGAVAFQPDHAHRTTPMVPARARSLGTPRPTLTIMSGMEAGRMIPLGKDTVVIGREADVGLTIDDPGLSRRHARIVSDGHGKYRIEDLGSTNGTLVAGRRVILAPLEPGDYVQLGGSLLVRFDLTDSAAEELQRQLYESSIHDPLTRVYNRRYFFGRLDAEMASARRAGDSLALLMIDVDEFKRFNDTFGHMPGDRALCFVAAQVLRLVRAGNVLARYGGEEFVVLSPGTGHAEAMRMAERVRRGIEGLRFSAAQTSVSLTVSAGVATLSELPDDSDGAALVTLADERLYAAKMGGRNRVCGA